MKAKLKTKVKHYAYTSKYYRYYKNTLNRISVVEQSDFNSDMHIQMKKSHTNAMSCFSKWNIEN